MPKSSPTTIAAFLLPFCVASSVASAQGTPAHEPPASSAAAPVQAPHHIVRRFPQDRDATVAIVGTRTLSLGDLVDHIDAKHYPGFRKAMETRPEFQRMLQSDLIAPWVRQFADIEALRQTTKEKVDEEKLTAAQSAALKKMFQGWLDAYVNDARSKGRPDPSQRTVNVLLSDFQLRNGLAAEMQGWLDYLEPDDYSRGQLQKFFTEHARYFGGRVNIRHILVQNRDAGTGILLAEAGVARAAARLADIKGRLLKDGSNFDELARLYSDDTKTAQQGGELKGILRFDDRLPAPLCRAAWLLEDGQVSDVVETQYGWHLVKRVDFDQNLFILFTDDAIPTIRDVMHRARQEERLFAARHDTQRQLMY